MKIAIPVWQERVSPVLDSAGSLLIVEHDGGGAEVGRREKAWPAGPLPRRAARLEELRVQVLICGAVSRALMGMLAGSGIEVIPWVSGEVDEVLEAYRDGRLSGARFAMPGCGRRRRRRGGRPGRRGRREGRGA